MSHKHIIGMMITKHTPERMLAGQVVAVIGDA